MSFIGRLASGASRFIGQASRGARFIGNNLGGISRAAHNTSGFLNSSLGQQIGNRIGISPNVMRSTASAINTVGNIAGLAPGAGRDVMNAVQSGPGQQATRSIADLYRQVHS
jgi:hypothetical protein